MLKIHSDMTSQNLWIDLKDDVASSHVSLRSILPEELTLKMPQVTQHKCVFTFFLYFHTQGTCFFQRDECNTVLLFNAYSL